jgi:hypothetical protein
MIDATNKCFFNENSDDELSKPGDQFLNIFTMTSQEFSAANANKHENSHKLFALVYACLFVWDSMSKNLPDVTKSKGTYFESMILIYKMYYDSFAVSDLFFFHIFPSLFTQKYLNIYKTFFSFNNPNCAQDHSNNMWYFSNAFNMMVSLSKSFEEYLSKCISMHKNNPNILKKLPQFILMSLVNLNSMKNCKLLCETKLDSIFDKLGKRKTKTT